jgi:hypothetical protein
MATLKPRGVIIEPTEGVSLRASFYDSNGDLADPTSFPSVTIIEPSGNIVVNNISTGVYKVSIGVYGYDYITSLAPSLGVYADVWRGTLADSTVKVLEYNFIVNYTQSPSTLNADGYYALGDDVGFDYSQSAIYNINKLLKSLKARLNSSGMSSGKDQFGNPIYVECDIFNVEQLVEFLATSLAAINSEPHFTMFEFHHSEIIKLLFYEIVQGALIYALASQALIERGSEYNIGDNGISVTVPTLSEMLNTQYSTEYNIWIEKVKRIKASMKPAVIGLGTVTGNVSRSPQFARLRWLRARQII